MRLILKELCTAVPGDVAAGIIIGKTKGEKIIFHNISDLSPQFQLDTVVAFDIIPYERERALLVKLAHWGN